MQNTWITKLFLENFRNFTTKKLDFNSNIILLCGKNGAGKTNILESLTLLGKSWDMRKADFEEMIFFDKNLSNNLKIQPEQFSIYSEISNHNSIEKIGISYEKLRKKKNLQINGEILNSRIFKSFRNELINFIWLTPQLELLLVSSKSNRREYLDKIVCDIDHEHLQRIALYQKSLKERLLILSKYRLQNQGDKWLEIVENKIVELGTAIAVARLEAVEFFNQAINSFESSFPKAKLMINGDIEEIIFQKSSLQVENFYLDKLKQNRASDLDGFKTNFGVHRSDFMAIYLNKNMLSSYSSTGEQKSIMIGITLARAKISASYKNQPTILIFDEIMSHLDKEKKRDLLEEISCTKLQSFLSATSLDLIPQDFSMLNFMQKIELN